MKFVTKILALGAVVAASASAAMADPINGSFFLNGNDTYTNSSVNIQNGALGAAGDTGTTGITGTFMNYLTDGTPVMLNSFTYTAGTTQTVTPPFQVFSVTENGETFTFDVDSYTATYNTYQDGDTSLTINGDGTFNGSGAMAFDPSPGSFDFSSQTVNGQTSTDFTVSAGASGMAVTPEPNSLILMGTGLVGAAGLLFMRRREADSLL